MGRCTGMSLARTEHRGRTARVVIVGLLLGALLGVAGAVTWTHIGTSSGAVESVAWSRWESVDARTVRVYARGYHSPSCFRPEPEVGYSEEAVNVRLRFRRMDESKFCTLEGGPANGQPITIVLREDLGGRLLVDG